MTTNKPGTVTQQPLYGCTSCYEECTYPADHLHVYEGECWCDLCWDERRYDYPDQPGWGDLEPYMPALQAECEKLRKDAARYQWLKHHAIKGSYDSDWEFPLVDAWEYRPGSEANVEHETLDAAIDAAMQADTPC